MTSTRRRAAALIAVLAGLTIGVPAADASAAGFPALAQRPSGPWAGGLPAFGAMPLAPGPCGTAVAEGQGSTGGTESRNCVGAGLVFVGPAVGQIAAVMGPTVIGPANIGTLVVSAGAVAGTG